MKIIGYSSLPDSDNDHKRIVIAQKVKTPTYRWSQNSH